MSWLETEKPNWTSCFSLESGERIEKYCHAHYGWLQLRGNAYEERLTDGILLLTNARLIFISRTGFINKSYLMSHYVGYKGILGISTGGWISKHIAIQVQFKRKRKVETLKYYLEPSELIPEYESFIREKQTQPLQTVKWDIQIEEIPKDKANCPSCGKPISPDFKLCPYCGAKLKETE